MKVVRTDFAELVQLSFEGRLDAAWSEPAAQELEAAIRLGRPRIEVDLAQVAFVSSVGNLLPFAPVAVFATGFSTTSWNGTPLPLPMDTFGMPGCTLYTAPELIFTVGASAGISNLPLTIPADPWFVGQQFHQQAFSFEVPGFNAFGGVLSNALTMTIGW